MRWPSKTARHEAPSGFAQSEDQREEDRDLQNSDASHDVLLKPLRTQQRVDQVHEQPQRGNTGDDVVHGFSLELVAGLREGPAYQQEQAADRNVEQIEHCGYSVLAKITSWPARRSSSASRLSAVGHQRLPPPITTSEPRLQDAIRSVSTRSRQRYMLTVVSTGLRLAITRKRRSFKSSSTGGLARGSGYGTICGTTSVIARPAVRQRAGLLSAASVGSTEVKTTEMFNRGLAPPGHGLRPCRYEIRSMRKLSYASVLPQSEVRSRSLKKS